MVVPYIQWLVLDFDSRAKTHVDLSLDEDEDETLKAVHYSELRFAIPIRLSFHSWNKTESALCWSTSSSSLFRALGSYTI